MMPARKPKKVTKLPAMSSYASTSGYQCNIKGTPLNPADDIAQGYYVGAQGYISETLPGLDVQEKRVSRGRRSRSDSAYEMNGDMAEPPISYELREAHEAHIRRNIRRDLIAQIKADKQRKTPKEEK